jgi:hypothetical protein
MAQCSRRRPVGGELHFLEEGMHMVNIYRLALQVQDASNPNGVINSLANEVMPAIRDEPDYRKIGTQYIKDHPALILFLDKLNSLCGIQSIGDADSYDRISKAYAACNERAKAPDQVRNPAGSNVPMTVDRDLPF